jgi:anhydro-N-acetylmuramic acid kinase
VLNLLVEPLGKAYDDAGAIASGGIVHRELLQALNALAYYRQAPPKSLANDFGTDLVFPLIKKYDLPVAGALCTMVEHIAWQLSRAVSGPEPDARLPESGTGAMPMLVTGGGAFNHYLVERIAALLTPHGVAPFVAESGLVQYKEAIIMALLGVLRWREEYNALASVTGAARNTINGALWLGGEA